MIAMTERSHDNMIEFVAEGDIKKEELEELGKKLEAMIEQYGTIHWSCVWKSCEYDSLGAFYADMMWMLRHVKDFGRMAIVGDAWWKKVLVKTDGLVFGEKYFDIADRDTAWAYVEGK